MNSSDEEFAGFSDEEDVPVLKLITSQKGKQMLSVNGTLFNLNKQANEHFYWECASRKHEKTSDTGCKSRVITHLQNGAHVLIDYKTAHNHDVNPLDEMENEYKTELKRTALASREVPSKIIREVSTRHEPIVQTRSSTRAQKMMISRKRATINAGLRVVEQDGEFVIPDELKQTLDGQLFLQKYIHDENNRIMIFTTISNLRRLAASRYWLVDGTFATVPLQCLSVQYQDLDAVVPLVFMLLSNKTQEIYTCAFEALLEIAQEAEINLHLRYVIADFEKAVVNVVKEIFPDAECYLCYFHFTQNLIKQLSFRGLKSMYSSDTNVYMAVKRLQALSFLPYPRISAAFESVKGHITQKLAGFLEYFSVTYVSGLNNNKRPTYHPALWSNYIAVKEKLPLTTNSLEAWHRRWTEVVGDNHLSITNIILELRKEQKEIEGRILRITQGNIAQASQNYLDKIKAICLNVDNITNEDFIERVALLLSTKQKRV